MLIYIHGNCQSTALRLLLSEVLTGATVRNREVHVAMGGEAEEYRQDIRHADIIVSQPIADKYPNGDYLSLKWIRQNKRTESKLLTFPSIFFRGFHPWMFYLRPLEVSGVPYHDLHVVDAFLSGKPADEVADEMAGKGFLPKDFVQVEYLRTLAELQRREISAGIDAPVTDLISAASIDFYAVNHPNRRLLVRLADRLLTMMGFDERAIPEGKEPLGAIVFPAYPSSGINLGAFGDFEEYVVWEKPFSRRDFVDLCYAEYQKIGRHAIMGALSENVEAGAYLDRFRRAPLDRGLDPLKVVAALYEGILGRRGSLNELVAQVRTLDERGLANTVRSIVESEEYAMKGKG